MEINMFDPHETRGVNDFGDVSFKILVHRVQNMFFNKPF
jgi:hypothetical protein